MFFLKTFSLQKNAKAQLFILHQAQLFPSKSFRKHSKSFREHNTVELRKYFISENSWSPDQEI